jgi:hypothetical protein
VLQAQDVSGTIEGSVLDSVGAGVPKAKVTVANTDRNTMDGNYSAPDIPIGNYVLRVEASGVRAATVSGIILKTSATF